MSDVPWWNATLFEGAPITPLRIGFALLAVLGAWLLSRWMRSLLERRAPGRLDAGAMYSLQRLLQYALVATTAFVVLAVIGLDLSAVAVVAGALGLGVGLGLQSITANFVSGLILLFERPVRPGDRVSLGTSERDAFGEVNGYVRAIRLRSTTIQTPDNILLIVPNSDLIGRTIVNWSHGDPNMRIRLNVGVAYDSDLDRVKEVMLEAAGAHPGTLESPEPEVRLVATADSALEFQLLVWIPDPRERGRIESAIRLDIVRRFREAGVSIPFPQRDVRLHRVRAGDGTDAAE